MPHELRRQEEDPNALFRRVWARVMPEDRVDCPFLVLPPPSEEAPVFSTGNAASPPLPISAQEGVEREDCLSLLQALTAAKAALIRPMSMGLAICPFIPAARAAAISSSNAFAVIAKIGMVLASERAILRISRVAP